MKYKEYNARTEADRVQLEMLMALDKIVELLTPIKQIETKQASAEEIEVIKMEVKKPRKK